MLNGLKQKNKRCLTNDVYRSIAKACNRLLKLETEGLEAYQAWNLNSVEFVKAAKV